MSTQTTTRVLLVEDDTALRETVALLLRHEGFEVVEAADGVEGLRALYSGPRPDVIILDLVMPRVNGQTFIAVKRSAPEFSGIPIIIYTAADVDPKNLEGGTLYLPKPAGSIKEITAKIVEVLRRTRDTLPPEE